MEKVINVAKMVKAQVTFHDLSIKHRLPARQEGTVKHVIVRFARRIGKASLLRVINIRFSGDNRVKKNR